ncbi:threonylcarbamoyl-AMP synthase [Halolactibacillus alkaliphilus]|uniref:Threonylcarbamoyl-AMP synthase n=1 Tax=Halolactibacillus alkaliphilus TaxID=442899 RepID=A0A511X3F6_9BACI|nr:L-threonylcarbamoyladenylate synthase [Halolactibacillus alkaliphilus]GEN57467.1 threonylcarbamoyl-AMP synthase [Halolactibacillus alkaliphilus]GGN68318.1 threonylcarbamoyl-AMP synthase [Halolactibacillus alkaliphilus]SFO95497.1 L-threonylcarbamoyladenylate synthase [Halolactibacillus alkaliphilus]
MSTAFLLWNDENIKKASEWLKNGDVVAFPTETVYGLGADATNEQAIQKIFEAKGRPSDNPLIVHLSDVEQMTRYVTEITPMAKRLIDAFMPGPLTVILKSNGKIAKNVTAGLDTVGLRIPDHLAARELIKAADLPIAAPSANLSGKPSPTSAVHVYQDLENKITAILDGGPTGVGVESTVVDCTGDRAIILRPGGITKQDLESVLDVPVEDATIFETKETPKSPGMKYTHYEPEVPMILIEGSADYFREKMTQHALEGKKVGLLVSDELGRQLKADTVVSVGSREDISSIANQLYNALRSFRKHDVDIILAETFTEEGVGQAVMNRMRKAATYIDQEREV